MEKGVTSTLPRLLHGLRTRQPPKIVTPPPPQGKTTKAAPGLTVLLSVLVPHDLQPLLVLERHHGGCSYPLLDAHHDVIMAPRKHCAFAAIAKKAFEFDAWASWGRPLAWKFSMLIPPNCMLSVHCPLSHSVPSVSLSSLYSASQAKPSHLSCFLPPVPCHLSMCAASLSKDHFSSPSLGPPLLPCWAPFLSLCTPPVTHWAFHILPGFRIRNGGLGQLGPRLGGGETAKGGGKGTDIDVWESCRLVC